MADTDLHPHRSNTDLERPLFLLQDRTDGEAVKLHRHEHVATYGRWMVAKIEHVIRSARTPRLSAAHVRSERSPLHDVRQHARHNGAQLRARSRCAISCFTDEHSRRSASLRKSFGGQPSRFEGWLANRGGLGREGWWSQTESNRRPPACKAGALPTELWPRTAVPSKGGNGGPGKI